MAGKQPGDDGGDGEGGGGVIVVGGGVVGGGGGGGGGGGVGGGSWLHVGVDWSHFADAWQVCEFDLSRLCPSWQWKEATVPMGYLPSTCGLL